MSYANKFLSTGEINVSDGSTTIYGSKIGAKSLIGTFDTIKIDNSGNLYPAKINSTDVEGIVVNPMTEDLDLGTNSIINANAVNCSQIIATATIGAPTITGTTINGTLATAAQPNITSLGILTSLETSGEIDVGGDISVSGNNINNVGTLSAVSVSGTLTTASQPNITSLGSLTGLTMNGTLNANSNNITGIGTAFATTFQGNVNATTISGTLTTAAQPNITSVGTLTSLTTSGDIDLTNNRLLNASDVDTIRLTSPDGSIGRVENLCAYSESFGTGWIISGGNVSILDNAEIAPNGKQNATKITINNPGLGLRLLTPDISNATQYRVNFWQKLILGNATPKRISVDLGDGTAILCNPLTTSWERCSLLITSGPTSKWIDLNFINGFSATEEISIFGVQITTDTSVEYPPFVPTIGTTITGTDYGIVSRYIRSTQNIETVNCYADNFYGNLTGTLQTASQPNITSLGTLTSLTISGNVESTGGFIIGRQSGTKRQPSIGAENQGLSGNQDIFLTYNITGAGPYTFTQTNVYNNEFPLLEVVQPGITPIPIEMKRIVFPYTGFYQITHNLRIDNGAGGATYTVEVYINDASQNLGLKTFTLASNDSEYESSTDYYYATAGDYFTLRITTASTDYDVVFGNVSAFRVSA